MPKVRPFFPRQMLPVAGKKGPEPPKPEHTRPASAHRLGFPRAKRPSLPAHPAPLDKYIDACLYIDQWGAMPQTRTTARPRGQTFPCRRRYHLGEQGAPRPDEAGRDPAAAGLGSSTGAAGTPSRGSTRPCAGILYDAAQEPLLLAHGRGSQPPPPAPIHSPGISMTLDTSIGGVRHD